MKIIEDLYGHYADALEKYNNYARFSDPNDMQTVFLNGMRYMEYQAYRNRYQNYKYRIFFNYEQPCAWYCKKSYAELSADIEGFFHKIYTACPYSAEWLNKIQGSKRFQKIYFPFNDEHIYPIPIEKTHDVLYWGGIHNPIHQRIVKYMSQFDYNFITLGPEYWNLSDKTQAQFITKTNIRRPDLWQLLRQTRINVIVNLLFIRPHEVINLKNIDRWEENEACSHIDQNIMPQFKTRAIESAINRCLMVVKKDPWNVIEHWFEPDTDFIYYRSEEELPEIITDVRDNWDRYVHIVNNAFDKALGNYTTRHIIKILEEIDV